MCAWAWSNSVSTTVIIQPDHAQISSHFADNGFAVLEALPNKRSIRHWQIILLNLIQLQLIAFHAAGGNESNDVFVVENNSEDIYITLEPREQRL